MNDRFPVAVVVVANRVARSTIAPTMKILWVSKVGQERPALPHWFNLSYFCGGAGTLSPYPAKPMHYF